MPHPQTLTADPCQCGHSTCKRVGIREMGTFYQGAGFQPEEFTELKRRWDAFPLLVAMVKVARDGVIFEQKRLSGMAHSTRHAALVIGQAEEVLLRLGINDFNFTEADLALIEKGPANVD